MMGQLHITETLQMGTDQFHFMIDIFSTKTQWTGGSSENIKQF